MRLPSMRCRSLAASQWRDIPDRVRHEPKRTILNFVGAALGGCRGRGCFSHPTGNHVAAWLHPEAQIDAGTNFQHYAQITQTAERGKFDLMFVADAVAVRDGNLAALSSWPQYMV